MDIMLADGGIETRIIYEFKRPIGHFEAYRLLADEASCDILRRIYESYVQVAVQHALPIQLGTPTWRASRKWTKDFESVNAAGVELLRTIIQQYGELRSDLAILGGCCGTDDRYIEALASAAVA
jgi:S-methylmethionine-dependent homocysteine/selenocysteine methylase